jgi:hypothetical protein
MSMSETFRFNLWSLRAAMIKSWILLGSLRGKRFAGRGAVLDDSSKHVRPSLNPDHSKTHIHSISLHGARILPVSIRWHSALKYANTWEFNQRKQHNQFPLSQAEWFHKRVKKNWLLMKKFKYCAYTVKTLIMYRKYHSIRTPCLLNSNV